MNVQRKVASGEKKGITRRTKSVNRREKVHASGNFYTKETHLKCRKRARMRVKDVRGIGE